MSPSRRTKSRGSSGSTKKLSTVDTLRRALRGPCILFAMACAMTSNTVGENTYLRGSEAPQRHEHMLLCAGGRTHTPVLTMSETYLQRNTQRRLADLHLATAQQHAMRSGWLCRQNGRARFGTLDVVQQLASGVVGDHLAALARLGLGHALDQHGAQRRRVRLVRGQQLCAAQKQGTVR